MINIIENYLNSSTCSFLTTTFNKYTHEIPDPGIYGGISKSEFCENIKLGFPITEYTEDPNYNICVDITTMLCTSMSKTISDKYDQEYVLRSIFYSDMQEGGENKLHVDNFYMDLNSNEMVARPGMEKDIAGLLYLNEEYEGGELNFPSQQFEIKPSPGSFVFFEGSLDLPHEVKKVVSGRRNNLICFFTPKK